MNVRPLRISAIGACLLISSAAFAGTVECDAVAKAMLAVPDQPGVRQVMTLGPTESGPTSIQLKDAMYMREDASKPWIKAPIDARKRRAMAQAGLKTLPLSACMKTASETLDGVAVDVYSFSQANPLKPGETGPSRILIGSADGLPRRMDMPGGMAMTFEYGDFQAPTP